MSEISTPEAETVTATVENEVSSSPKDEEEGASSTEADKEALCNTDDKRASSNEEGKPALSCVKEQPRSSSVLDLGDESTAISTAFFNEGIKESPSEVEKGTEGSNQDDTTEGSPSSPGLCKRIWDRVWKFYVNNDFVIMIVLAICLAKAYPPLGAEYLQPQITSTWIAVVFIFVLAGLGLRTDELSKAFQRFKFNLLVQVFNFGVVSGIVYGVSRGLVGVRALSQSLADGMVVCGSLPMAINMVLVLTKSSGGDEAAAIFNAAFGNLIGVFLSPVLILGYLGVKGDVDLWDVFYKLALRVVAPVLFGQLLQKFCPPVVEFNKKYKKYFKDAQQYALVFIVYCVFCETFSSPNDSNLADVFVMIAVIVCLLCILMVLAWYTLKVFYSKKPTLRVMGLFGCTEKTVAMGVPLINAMYEGNPNVGLYTLPLLIWHPTQLIVGSFLAPKLYGWVEREKLRPGLSDAENNE